jgi:hypothetical protein
MLQIRFAFAGNYGNEDSLKVILPTGYEVKAVEAGKKYDVFTDSGNMVGSIEIVEGAVAISFYDNPEGQDFVSAWGLKHQTHNPKTILYGYVYYVLETDRWQLDHVPTVLLETAMEMIGNYDQADNTYFVSFLRGEWKSDSLTVLSMQKVKREGKLARNTGPTTLLLGNIENSWSMQ